MSAIEQIRALYEYNEWANNHVLDAASKLGEDELDREMGASFGSVQGNLVHTVGAQVLWVARWAQSGPVGMPRLETGQVLKALRDAYTKSHEELRGFVKSLSAEDLTAVLPYADSRGDRLQRPLGQLMVHMVNHGTHHRAETAMLLTALEKPPRQLDYLFFELERS